MSKPVSIKIFKDAKCEHKQIVVDEALWQIECAECGKILDPIYYLAQIARKEIRVQWNIDELRKEEQKISQKLRCKCDHCGKMTRI